MEMLPELLASVLGLALGWLLGWALYKYWSSSLISDHRHLLGVLENQYRQIEKLNTALVCKESGDKEQHDQMKNLKKKCLSCHRPVPEKEEYPYSSHAPDCMLACSWKRQYRDAKLSRVGVSDSKHVGCDRCANPVAKFAVVVTDLNGDEIYDGVDLCGLCVERLGFTKKSNA